MMDAHASPRPESAPAPGVLGRPMRGLLRRIGTSNPFYLLSALLVCVGLRMSFDPHANILKTWALLGGMAGYTLLLAAAACLLVRFGNVWEDIRTILLLVVLMLLSISVTFDGVLALDLRQGVACYLAGLAFAIAVSEGLLRAMRFRLPIGYRLPYFLFLALFFLYPVALSPLLRRPTSPVLQWALFGFSPVAGLLALTLLPAIRRGPAYLAKNGTPWRWPYYPWSLFVFLGLGVCARAYYLCWSMHRLEAPYLFGNIFGPYFLVPFLLAVAVLLLELGLVARNRTLTYLALNLPAALVGLTLLGHRPEPVYQRFLGLFQAGLGGSPLYLAILCAAAFFAYAALRRVPLAAGMLSFAVASLAIVGPGTVTLAGLVEPRGWPLLLVGAFQAALALRRRNSGWWLVAAACLVAGSTFAAGGSLSTTGRELLAFHLATAAAMAIGAAFNDDLGRLLRGAGAAMLLLAGAAATLGRPDSVAGVPPALIRAYPLMLAGIAAGYGLMIGHRAYLAAAAAGLGCWLTVAGWGIYGLMRRHVAGLDHITLGLTSLALAMIISLMKAGALQRWLARRQGRLTRSP